MWAAEVAADHVWLTLAPVEEPARLGGELGLVAGPAVLRKAPFEVGVDQFVGQLRRVRRQEVQLDAVRVIGQPSAELAGAVYGAAVRRTIGVRPLAPQMRPVTWSKRMPTWSTKGTSPPSAFTFTFTRIASHASSRQTRTASWFCSTARLSGRWNDRPSGAGICPRPARSAAPGTASRSGPPHQHASTAAPPAPMLADPAPTRLGHESLTPAAEGPPAPTATTAVRRPPVHSHRHQ